MSLLHCHLGSVPGLLGSISTSNRARLPGNKIYAANFEILTWGGVQVLDLDLLPVLAELKQLIINSIATGTFVSICSANYSRLWLRSINALNAEAQNLDISDLITLG
jgi:hypothetical protein